MGFKIIRDFIKDKGEKGAVGVESLKPNNIFQAFIGMDMDDPMYEYNGGKVKVRLVDDDGKVHHHAYIDVEGDENDISGEMLLKWGMSYSGSVSTDMYLEDWIALYGEPDERSKSLISEDGKWFGYMG